jgi:hypothetical protein
MLLVACHTWDTLGAVAAGWQAALIRRPGNDMLGVGPQPASKIGSSTQHRCRHADPISQARDANGLSLPLAFGMYTLLMGSGLSPTGKRRLSRRTPTAAIRLATEFPQSLRAAEISSQSGRPW